MEEWKDIKCYEGLYQISDLGRVKSLDARLWNGHGFMIRKGKILACSINPVWGYRCVGLSKDNNVKQHRVNRLVALAFIKNSQNKPDVNHINENKLDNKVSNLEWVTHKENCNHGTRIKRIAIKKMVAIIGKCEKSNEYIYFSSFKEASTKGFDASTIYKCINNKAYYKTHKGYAWTRA